MSRSGVGVSADCVPAFEELKLGKKTKYIIYKLNDAKNEIIVDQKGSDADYEVFLDSLPEQDCRWAIYDFEYKLGDEGQRNKICFFSWSPDNAPVRSKMIYASSKDGLRRALNGVAVEIQGSDHSEVSHEAVLEKCVKGR